MNLSKLKTRLIKKRPFETEVTIKLDGSFVGSVKIYNQATFKWQAREQAIKEVTENLTVTATKSHHISDQNFAKLNSKLKVLN